MEAVGTDVDWKVVRTAWWSVSWGTISSEREEDSGATGKEGLRQGRQGKQKREEELAWAVDEGRGRDGERLSRRRGRLSKSYETSKKAERGEELLNRMLSYRAHFLLPPSRLRTRSWVVS
jgi:hypothetical protein